MTIAILITLGLERSKLAPFSLKVAWFLATLSNLATIYLAGSDLHWPFEHRANAYYEVMYHFCRFLAWAVGPIVSASFWLREYYQYPKARAAVLSSLAAVD